MSFENKSFFLLFGNVATFIEGHKVIFFLCYFLQYDEE